MINSSTVVVQVVSFKQADLRQFVIIKPAWLYTDLVSLIMSEHPLPAPYVQYENGYTRLSDVIALLNTAHPDVSGEVAVKMLSDLGFVIIYKEDVLVPVKLKKRRPKEYWPSVPRVLIK